MQSCRTADKYRPVNFFYTEYDDSVTTVIDDVEKRLKRARFETVKRIDDNY